MSYDSWKTSIPEGSPWCERCGEHEIEAIYGIGKIKVCEDCFDELEELDRKENLMAGAGEGSPTPPVPISPVTTERGSDANAVQGATDQKQSAA